MPGCILQHSIMPKGKCFAQIWHKHLLGGRNLPMFYPVFHSNISPPIITIIVRINLILVRNLNEARSIQINYAIIRAMESDERT